MGNRYRVTFKASEYTALDLGAADAEEALHRAREHWRNQYLDFGEDGSDGQTLLQNIRIEGLQSGEVLEWQAPGQVPASAEMLDAIRQARDALKSMFFLETPQQAAKRRDIVALCDQLIARTLGDGIEDRSGRVIGRGGSKAV